VGKPAGLAVSSLRSILPPMTILLPDEAATGRLGQLLAQAVAPGDVIALDGPLGAGKTTLVRALVEGLGGDPAQVSSPTFTLLHRYHARWPVVHVDAYRLQDAAALAGLGFDELAEDGIGVIEWAERVATALPAGSTWRLALEHRPSGRAAHLAPPPGRSPPWLRAGPSL
jgi:tRNA threonylcarbamoyl adenosine modification protein YjeE